MPNQLDGPRPARADELDALLETVNQVHRVSRGSQPIIREEWAHIYNPENVGNITIFRDGDAVAGSVGIWVNDIAMDDAELRVGGINCLAVLPEYRKAGLGSQLMKKANERMAEMGCGVALLGTAITRWYQKLGWEEAGVSLNFTINHGNIHLLPELPKNVELCVAGEEAIDDIVKLRNSERLGGLRDAETFRLLFRTRARNNIFILAKSGDAAVGYLMATDETVSEWAGAPDIVAGLARAWFEHNIDPKASTSTREEWFKPVVKDSLKIGSPAGGHGFIEMLEQLRFPFTIGYAGLMYLLDPRGVLDAFGCDDISVRADGEGFVIGRAGQEIALSRRQTTKLFFGPEKVSSFAEDIFPLPFRQWSIEHV